MGNQTTGIQNLKMEQYWNILIEDACIEEQNRFEYIYSQANKSKSELQQSIENINKVMKSLLP